MLRTHLILMGMRGSGKTSIGQRVAERLEVDFCDLDELTLESFGEDSVRAVWENHGEPAWRAAEVRALSDALRALPRVIALGGGTPVISEARTRLTRARAQGACTLVYLAAPAEELRRRLLDACADRPSLTGANPLDELADVLRVRDPLYRDLADIIIETAELSFDETVDRVIDSVS